MAYKRPQRLLPLFLTSRSNSPFLSPHLPKHQSPEDSFAISPAIDVFSDDLLDESYQDATFVQGKNQHINELVTRFVPQITRDEAFNGAQELGFPWGAIRMPDELLDDPHLKDRNFWVQVEHPELGRTFTYPGGAALYGNTPWRISSRAPLIGEHNQEILCGKLGLSPQELTVLAESGVV